MPTQFKVATSTDQLKAIAGGVVESGLKFKSLIKTQSDIAAAQKVKLIDEPLKILDSVIAQVSEPDQRASYSQQRKTHAELSEKTFSTWSKSHIKASDKERWGALKEMQTAYDALSFAKENMTSSRRLASAHGIGTEERSRYDAQLSNAGPAVRAMLAKKAVAEKNASLAASLIAANDSAPRNERTFSSDDIAESIWGQEAQLNRALYDAADLEISRAIRINRDFEQKPATPLELIEDALKFPNGLNEPPKKVESGEMDSTQRIMAGLNATLKEYNVT